jgi:hypothetical protein
MKTTAERVKEILGAGFPHWSQWDVDGLTPFLMAFFKEQTKKDPSYVVAATSELYSYFEEKVVGRGKIEKRDVGPGLIVYHLKRFTKESERLKSLYKNKRTYELQIQNLEDNINAVNEIESAFSSHNNFESLDAIRAYMKEIDSIVTFSRKQMPAWAIMREVSEELVQGATLEVFWLEVKARCIEDGIVIKDKDDQWRQLKKRILDRINAKARGTEGMLQMVSVSAEELALRKLLNVVSDIQRNNDINRILSEYQWPDSFRNDVSIIVKLVIQMLRAPSGAIGKDYIHSKFEEEVDELVSILQDFDRSNLDGILKDASLTDTSLLVKASLLVLLSILKDLNEEEMKILKDWIHA